MKSPFKSMTLWVNVIVAVAAFFPAVAAVLTPEIALSILGLVNIGLRFKTKDALGLK